HHPDDGTRDVVAQVEAQVPTIRMDEELRKLGLWDDSRPVDPVRITPWGTADRPYLFEEATTVSLSAPLVEGAAIRFTTAGSGPGGDSPLSPGPSPVSASTTIRAAAFDRDGRPVGLPGAAVLIRLPAKPPRPDVSLADLKPLRATCSGYHAFGSHKKP